MCTVLLGAWYQRTFCTLSAACLSIWSHRSREECLAIVACNRPCNPFFSGKFKSPLTPSPFTFFVSPEDGLIAMKDIISPARVVAGAFLHGTAEPRIVHAEDSSDCGAQGSVT